MEDRRDLTDAECAREEVREAQRLADVAGEERMTRPWRLRKPLDLGDCDCAGEVEGPEGAYFDFSDSERWSNAEAVSLERLLAAANAAEVYRKALEPFAMLYAEYARQGSLAADMFDGLRMGHPHLDQMAEACRLMGIPLSEDQP